MPKKIEQICGAQHLARGHEVTGDADEEVGHVLPRLERAREVVDGWRETDGGADEALDDPLAAELGAARALVTGKGAVRVAR